MDINALLSPLVAFFSDGFGKVLADAARFLYTVLFPSNAEAARPIEIPR